MSHASFRCSPASQSIVQHIEWIDHRFGSTRSPFILIHAPIEAKLALPFSMLALSFLTRSLPLAKSALPFLTLSLPFLARSLPFPKPRLSFIDLRLALRKRALAFLIQSPPFPKPQLQCVFRIFLKPRTSCYNQGEKARDKAIHDRAKLSLGRIWAEAIFSSPLRP